VEKRYGTAGVPGYFRKPVIGLLFLYSLSSALVGGVGRDAEHIVDHIESTRLGRRETVEVLVAPQ